jgi:hypothetical protein
MKRLLLIICLLPVLAYGQFSGAKKLLLQQGEYCEYGNLNEFTYEAGGFCYNFYFSNCPGIARLTSLNDCHYVLDSYRDGCTYSQGSSGSVGFTDSLAVGHYVLNRIGGTVVCDLRLFNVDTEWFISTPMGAVGNVVIMRIINSVITYIEYY